uniref:RNA pseudouridine synthase 7 n=1 Tax=Kalanchoe fedtschenkoi TaxID=63787 RepID=A0A7N0TG37_KALFE
MKRKRDGGMEIVWQTPANTPEKSDYVFVNGRRHVKPYYFEFISHVKNRWAGKTIVDLFAQEFKGRPYDYYVSAVKSGRILVDGQMVPISYVVRSSQKISHFLHRHEPPVMAWDVSILQKETDVVTVCKPASVPVHPCGQYRKNTIIGILQAEYDLAPLFPIHRLDRLVSGLLILATNSTRADIFRQQIEAGLVQKQYVARVVGVFPEGEQVVKANIEYNAREGKSTAEVEEDKYSNTPLKGKTACTKFTRISTDGNQSIVLCEPVTGRTHQIRVHLRHTGHPIANDYLYLSADANLRTVEGMSADRAASMSRLSAGITLTRDPTNHLPEHSNEDFTTDPMCTNCPNLAPKGYDGHEEALWLHCVHYSGPDWSYECPYPDWASF